MLDIPKTIADFAEKLPSTAKLRLFGLAKIPLIFLTSPKVTHLSSDHATIEVPLNYMTKNHLNSMYFGALAVGADSVVAILAIQIAKGFPDYNIIPVFKNFNADFIKRAEENVLFQCEAGTKVRQMIEKAIATGERVTEDIEASAYGISDKNSPVAKFTLGLSFKAVPKHKKTVTAFTSKKVT